MPAKQITPQEDAPKKPVRKKATPLAEPVETNVPPKDEAVPAKGDIEEPVVTAPAPVAEVKPVPPAVPVPPVLPAAPIPPVPAVANTMPSFSRIPLMKPGMVQVIAIITLINGILNILYGLIVTGSIVLGTFFIGLLCVPVTILPAILGIFEIIYATKLLANPPQPVRPSQTIAILEIIAVISGNVLSAIVGVLALVFYSDASVKAYFARLNGQA